MTGVLI